MRRRMGRKFAAFRDGELSPAAHRRLERRISDSPELGAELSRQDALSRLTREAWREGPPAPATDYLIASLRPGLARIDAQLMAAPFWRRWVTRLEPLGSAVPLGALAGAAVVVALLVAQPGLRGLMAPESPVPQRLAQAPGISPDAAASRLVEVQDPGPRMDFGLGMPSAVYDLAQGDTPLMLFEAPDGSTVIWLIEEDESLSFSLPHDDGWA